tara:strand:+ start:8850 stop:9050 length:201 start_codon:yes stop_codon:yes gene_type:complete
MDNKEITNEKKSLHQKESIEQKLNDRKNKWLRGKGMCEWCGKHPATVNLELKYGTHRECRYCWDRS